MAEALAVRRDPLDLDVMQLGRVLSESGFFQDSKEAAQAVVKILAGRELGVGPVAAMTGIYIVKGRVTLSANLIAASIKRSGRYDYLVVEHTEEFCTISFVENGTKVGESTFTMADAKQAELLEVWDIKTNKYKPNLAWKNYPRNMLFARALSNGARWYCPDVFGGAPPYTPDELGETIDPETGEILGSRPESSVPRVGPSQAPSVVNGTGKGENSDLDREDQEQREGAPAGDDGKSPGKVAGTGTPHFSENPEEGLSAITADREEMAEQAEKISDPQMRKLHALSRELGLSREERLHVAKASLKLAFLYSFNQLTKDQASELIELLATEVESSRSEGEAAGDGSEGGTSSPPSERVAPPPSDPQSDLERLRHEARFLYGSEGRVVLAHRRLAGKVTSFNDLADGDLAALIAKRAGEEA